jgi:hypothetical protein
MKGGNVLREKRRSRFNSMLEERWERRQFGDEQQ